MKLQDLQEAKTIDQPYVAILRKTYQRAKENNRHAEAHILQSFDEAKHQLSITLGKPIRDTVQGSAKKRFIVWQLPDGFRVELRETGGYVFDSPYLNVYKVFRHNLRSTKK